jgi:hypothetical protein
MGTAEWLQDGVWKLRSGYRTEYGNCGVDTGWSMETAVWLQDGVWKLRCGYRTEYGNCGIDRNINF